MSAIFSHWMVLRVEDSMRRVSLRKECCCSSVYGLPGKRMGLRRKPTALVQSFSLAALASPCQRKPGTSCSRSAFAHCPLASVGAGAGSRAVTASPIRCASKSAFVILGKLGRALT